MSFRLVPKSVTLNDHERCNTGSPEVCVILPNSVDFGSALRKSGKTILAATEM